MWITLKFYVMFWAEQILIWPNSASLCKLLCSISVRLIWFLQNVWDFWHFPSRIDFFGNFENSERDTQLATCWLGWGWKWSLPPFLDLKVKSKNFIGRTLALDLFFILLTSSLPKEFKRRAINLLSHTFKVCLKHWIPFVRIHQKN